MAEAACGPSNALSQFKQHQAVDRSLQEDRLNNRHLNRNPQNFRSINPNVAHLDADFEAFQAGFSPPVLDHGLPLHNQLLQNNFPVQAHKQPHEAPSWANDFQQLHISSPNASSSSSNWAQGFQQHIAQSAPRAQTSIQQSPLAFQQQARYGLTGFQSSFTPQQQFHNAAGVQSKGKEPVLAKHYDEAAFERAFDMAREDMMADVEQDDQQQPIQEDADLEAMIERVEAATQQEATKMLNQVATEDDRYWRPEDTIHGSDIEYQPFYEPVHDEQQQVIHEEEQEQQRQNHDDDQLAATAQELLEKVSHDQSDKFKNSQFLSLMRKLRDREVRVEGDQMVETTTTANAISTSNDAAALNASSSTFNNNNIPLGGLQPQHHLVDTRPVEYGIPPSEQDLDSGRLINPTDGQDVVHLLDDSNAMAEVQETVVEDSQPEVETEDMGESTPPISSSYLQNSSIVDMLYGKNGIFSSEDDDVVLPSPLKLGG